jgi:hypothetical protein
MYRLLMSIESVKLTSTDEHKKVKEYIRRQAGKGIHPNSEASSTQGRGFQ